MSLLLPEGRTGEVAVIGLGRSGRSVAELLGQRGHSVYASDAGTGEAVRRAAQELTARNVSCSIGDHDLGRIARAAAVVVSPGVPPEAPPLATARAAGVPIVSEIDIALRAMPSQRYIAITGTNGKTTTTALIGHLLRALGHDAPEAGNIGTPLSEIALRAVLPAWIALEVSSFQLHDTPSIAPSVGVVTNLSPDHLDRYRGVDDYYADKARLFANASAASRWVLNADEPEVLALYQRLPQATATLPGHTYRFSIGAAEAESWLNRPDDTLMVLGNVLMPRRDLQLVGDHNVANALTAALAVMVADAAHRTPEARGVMADALRSFRALPHRLEPVGIFGGVTWINDSKATNVGSTLVAIEGMRQPTVVLLGGRHKGDPYRPLIPALRSVAKLVIAYGEAGEEIEKDLAGHVPFERLGSSFAQVISRARAVAAPGDAVLLSPACSSYDMFSNYEERGATFRRLAAEVAP